MTEDRDEKRVALVTGSTSGIGMAIAKRLAKDGFTVAFHSKSSVLIIFRLICPTKANLVI